MILKKKIALKADDTQR